jgi:hypothetical protein
VNDGKNETKRGICKNENIRYKNGNNNSRIVFCLYILRVQSGRSGPAVLYNAMGRVWQRQWAV